MSDAVPYPYTTEVTPLAELEGQFRWTIRKSGKLMDRSDARTAARKACESAMEAVGRAMKPCADLGRRV